MWCQVTLCWVYHAMQPRLRARNWGRESDPMRRDTSPYFYDSFTRQQWARFDAGSYRLAPAALTLLKGVNEPMPISEVEEVIGPLCRLLDIQTEANDVRPFFIAVAGRVAVGKSTFA